MRDLPFILLLPILFLASCASEKSATTAPPRKNMMERMNENNGYKQNAEGEWSAQSGKRSEFESKGESTYFQKDFKKQEYKTGDYARKSWWGGKEYDRKSFAGNTDGSRFAKNSDLGSKGAREAGATMDTPGSYETGSYDTSTARETNTGGIARPSNAQDRVSQKQKQFTQPRIVDWREQRSLSIGESKGILGR